MFPIWISCWRTFTGHKSISAATSLTEELFRFSSRAFENDKAYFACREKLLTAGYGYEELMPGVGRSPVAISTAGSSLEAASLKSIARFTGLVIQRCMLIHEEYYILFA